jgi:hypothetical protein
VTERWNPGEVQGTSGGVTTDHEILRLRVGPGRVEVVARVGPEGDPAERVEGALRP